VKTGENDRNSVFLDRMQFFIGGLEKVDMQNTDAEEIISKGFLDFCCLCDL
jgi:hypothetical protein